MGEQGYAISERDYRRIEETIRRVERMADVNFRRRFPVSGWSPGGSGGGWPIPEGRVDFISTTDRQINRELHRNKWLMCHNKGDPPAFLVGDDFNLVLPPNPTINDFYYFECHNCAIYDVHIYPAVGQTIIMPSETFSYGLSKYIDLGYNVWDIPNNKYYGQNQLCLICNAVNQWICVSATHSSVEIG